MNKLLFSHLSLVLLSIAFTLIACGQDVPSGVSRPQKVDQKRIVIKPESLPRPYETKSVMNNPRVTPAPAGAALQVPDGFAVEVFAEGGFEYPRWVIEGPNGDLFLSDSKAGKVFLLRDSNKDGKIDSSTERFSFLEGLNRPLGMAIQRSHARVVESFTAIRVQSCPHPHEKR